MLESNVLVRLRMFKLNCIYLGLTKKKLKGKKILLLAIMARETKQKIVSIPNLLKVSKESNFLLFLINV